MNDGNSNDGNVEYTELIHRNDNNKLITNHQLTKFQITKVDDYVNLKGMGEGVVKTFKRLQYDFGIKKTHYATVGGNPNAEIAMLDESNPLESNINWDTYVQACARASTPNVYKTAIQNLQASFPITNFEFFSRVADPYGLSQSISSGDA